MLDPSASPLHPSEHLPRSDYDCVSLCASGLISQMRRPQCSEKVELKKGPWTPEEDTKLLAYIEEHGHGSWRALPAKAGLQRCGKSCRLRWTNYLRPDIRRGKFSLEEEQAIIQLHALIGNRWSAIATHLPKRTDNEIKNYWNTHLKKRLTKMGIDPVTHKPKTDGLSSGGGHSKDATNLSHMAQWESARLEAEARQVRQSKLVSSNPIQQELSTAAPAELNGKTQAQPALPPCLDVLKVWRGVWSKPTSAGVFPITGDDLESPTSTLNFPENALPIHNVAFNERTATGAFDFAKSSAACKGKLICQMPELNEGSDDRMALQEMTYTMESAWLVDSFGAGIETMHLSNVMEGFTDALCYNGDDQNPLMVLDNLDNVDKSCSGDFEDSNKSYWNSVLGLMNASSSGSRL